MSRPLFSDVDRLFPLGARVYATRDTGVCSLGERGIVVESYQIDARPGRTIIFEQGGYDGFSPSELALMVIAEGSLDPAAASYPYHSSMRLTQDYRRGCFDFKTSLSYAEFLAQSEHAQIDETTLSAPRRSGPSARI